MASLLTTHLEQIFLCATSIADLSFPAPKVFTNALLHTHDITALIRDTEAHERALFHLAPPPLSIKGSDFASSASSSAAPASSAAGRRATTYGVRQPKSRAVAAVLGGDLYQKTRKATDSGASSRQKGDIDVDVLLEGAEKLAAVYPIPGAADRIDSLRTRYQELAASIAHYEDRVGRNAQELQLMNRPSSRGGYRDQNDESVAAGGAAGPEQVDSGTAKMTIEDLRREEEEVKELERKKRGLEERVTGMEKDLGGLMR
ncbi:hypothetical protein LTR91_021286 [Friedmanniomyces endolithicus]|uniref:DASH complex subunit SPC34 n=1 Tax=Friedmanniomyces endolithicus TaxID=329885 RepID=A0AAN6F5Z2_9PEZI|nr:hypothetical protein LTR35_017376 [Friedmanniomyces endolithicus]KAK0291505.1 hypothetical protein LTS00_008196 [Friedmanniomyces endolithicus]KAK0303947.1 hypothetical protein LTR82_017395 [Friedmanniomyces endolithicus]KAK0825748.1 hypothetical protein LTR73_006903 [Friedmanniomyces endolithicus]KAK0910020.1 hypothetical protein LTR57_016099 [Friedmanniomyces endolithicus]